MNRSQEPPLKKAPAGALEDAEEATARLAAIVTSSSDAIISKTIDGTVVTWNEAAARLFGYGEEEMVGLPIKQLIPEQLQNEEDSILARIAAGGPIQNYETLRLHKDGRLLQVSVTISPIRDAAGNVTGASKIARDIAERRRIEEQFQILADGIPTLCWMAEPDGHIYWYNKRWYGYTGTTLEEMQGWGWQSVHDPEVLPVVLERWRASLATGTPFEMTFPLRGADGVFRPFLTRVAPDLGPDGRVRRWLGVNTDLTEERRMRAALEESEARLRLFIERAPVAIAMFDKDMRYVAASRRFVANVELDGESPESLPGRSHYELFPEISDRWREVHRRVLAGETLSGDEDEFLRLNGTTGWVRWEMTPWRLPDGSVGGALLFSEIITQRRQADAALRESRLRQQGMIQSAMDAIIAIDGGQRIVLFNPAAEKMFGCPASEALGSSIDRFIPEPFRRAHRDHVRRFGAAGTTSRQMGALGSLWGLRQGGEEFPIEASISQLLVGGQKLFTAILRDITERKRHEEQTQLLLREINHRSKNMLAVVQAIARQTLAAKPEDFIGRLGDRIRALSASQDLLIANEWKGVDIAELVQSQLAHFQDLIGTRIELRGPSFLISPSAAQTIGMALHELSTNAGKYGALSNGDGRLEVGWNLERPGDAQAAFVMFWNEQAGPPVTAPAGRGFGSTVIQDLVAESLDAEVDLDFGESGLSWRLRCRAKEVIEGHASLLLAL